MTDPITVTKVNEVGKVALILIPPSVISFFWHSQNSHDKFLNCLTEPNQSSPSKGCLNFTTSNTGCSWASVHIDRWEQESFEIWGALNSRSSKLLNKWFNQRQLVILFPLSWSLLSCMLSLNVPSSIVVIWLSCRNTKRRFFNFWNISALRYLSLFPSKSKRVNVPGKLSSLKSVIKLLDRTRYLKLVFSANVPSSIWVSLFLLKSIFLYSLKFLNSFFVIVFILLPFKLRSSTFGNIQSLATSILLFVMSSFLLFWKVVQNVLLEILFEKSVNDDRVFRLLKE